MLFVPDGVALLRKFEGLKLDAYQDVGGIWTIGYGHTAGVCSGMRITAEEAESYLFSDVSDLLKPVQDQIHPSANDNQFSAAVCFAFNIIGWKHTPLFIILMQGDFVNAGRHWLLYDKAMINGVKTSVPGLVARRQAELALFNTAVIGGKIS